MNDTVQRTAQPSFSIRFGSYLINHSRVFFASLGRIFYSPLASLMTIAVIAIALALPAGFYVILKNAQKVSGGWDGAAKISVYLDLEIQAQRAEALVAQFKKWDSVASVRFIDRDAALKEFQSLSGFRQALDALDENPLPAVIEITPRIEAENPLMLEQLSRKIENETGVDIVQLDMQWVKRLYSIMNIVQRALLVAAAMLGIAVILIIGNTIRLDIQNRRSEIIVIKLIGGTNAFIRRPFLYTGMWYGLLGGILGALLISNALWMLNSPVQRLAGLYDSHFELTNLGVGNTLFLIIIAITLGYLGSWLAVGRHLREIEPG